MKNYNKNKRVKILKLNNDDLKILEQIKRIKMENETEDEDELMELVFNYYYNIGITSNRLTDVIRYYIKTLSMDK